MRIRTLSLLTVMSAVSLSAMAAAPTVSPEAKKAADMINADAPMQKMLTELTSPQGQKWRFNTQMEIVRIASPSVGSSHDSDGWHYQRCRPSKS